ncbi:hypothetical protein C0Q70_11196 [Pomacea canaliculata]|uniref:Uncharacterized protein n=1 Tax=Pomacea canaliculata TaxID=400727 RepID=A0A2T7P5D1_POMCA|nr:hypothetical protein C0Q70_11196 [Pomacea canaliculata]
MPMVFGQDQSPEDSDSDEEEENITSVEFLPGESTSVVLPPHQRCAAHTLNLVASKDSEAALQDGAFRTASRSLFAKAQAVWNKQSRVVSAAESIQEATGRQMIIPNQNPLEFYRGSVFHAVPAAGIVSTNCDSSSKRRRQPRADITCCRSVKNEISLMM